MSTSPGSGLTVTVPVAGQRVVVVGAGAVAARRVGTLVELGARVVVIGPQVHAALADLARAGTIEVHERTFVPTDLAGARLVFAATDVGAVNAEVRDRAREAGIWVNRADEPADCDFTDRKSTRLNSSH